MLKRTIITIHPRTMVATNLHTNILRLQNETPPGKAMSFHYKLVKTKGFRGAPREIILPPNCLKTLKELEITPNFELKSIGSKEDFKKAHQLAQNKTNWKQDNVDYLQNC